MDTNNNPTSIDSHLSGVSNPHRQATSSQPASSRHQSRFASHLDTGAVSLSYAPIHRRPILRQNASPSKEISCMNYFAPSSPDTVPFPTTGFNASDASIPNLSHQPTIQPQNSPAISAIEDGLSSLAAPSGHLFISTGCEFILPSPRIPIQGSSRCRLSKLAVNEQAKDDIDRSATEKRKQENDAELYELGRQIPMTEEAEAKEKSLDDFIARQCYKALDRSSSQDTRASRSQEAQSRGSSVSDGNDEDVLSAFEDQSDMIFGLHSVAKSQPAHQPDRNVWLEMLETEKTVEMVEAVMRKAEEIGSASNTSAFTKDFAAEDEVWPLFYEHKGLNDEAPNKGQEQEDHWVSKSFMAEWENMETQMSLRRVAPAYVSRNVNSRETCNKKHSGASFLTKSISWSKSTYTFSQEMGRPQLPFQTQGPPPRQPPIATHGDQYGHGLSGKKDIDNTGSDDQYGPQSKNLNRINNLGGLPNQALIFLNQYFSADKTSRIGKDLVKQQDKQEKTQSDAEEAKHNLWEASNKNSLQSIVCDADTRAQETRSCKAPNANLLERLREVDRKHAALKVDTLLAQRLGTQGQETLRKSCAHNDYSQSLVPISASLMVDPPQEDELHDNRDEIAPPRPSLPELFRISKNNGDNAKRLASLMGFGSWVELSEEQQELYYERELGHPSLPHLFPHDKEDKLSIFQFRRNPFSFEFTPSSAIENQLEGKLNKTVSTVDDYLILREEPLILQPKFPVLRLRSALNADGTIIYPESLITKEAAERTKHYDVDMQKPHDMMVNSTEYIGQEEIDENNTAMIISDRRPRRGTRFCLGSQSDEDEENFYDCPRPPKKNTIFQLGSSLKDATFQVPEEDQESRPVNNSEAEPESLQESQLSQVQMHEGIANVGGGDWDNCETESDTGAVVEYGFEII